MIKEILFKWFGIEEPPCASCETLRGQLEFVNFEKKQLLDAILRLTNPQFETPHNEQETQPIRPKNIPWTVKRQMLEEEDRVRARVIERTRKDIDELEKELGVGEEANNG